MGILLIVLHLSPVVITGTKNITLKKKKKEMKMARNGEDSNEVVILGLTILPDE